jgi:DNA-binding transcriptional ArsR family regulator
MVPSRIGIGTSRWTCTSYLASLEADTAATITPRRKRLTVEELDIRARFSDYRVCVNLDADLSRSTIEQRESGPEHADTLHLVAEWAPPYELLLSIDLFVHAKTHGLFELGSPWVHAIHEQLPAEAAVQLTRKSVARLLKDADEILVQLAYACPDKADVAGFLGWFGQLTAGSAYEALAPVVREPGPRLARDFNAWRDNILDLLGVWNSAYFRHVDPAILHGLREQASLLRARIPRSKPGELVESVTNGLVVEAAADLHNVVLVPQYHHRPYNTDVGIHDGLIILYPCDAAVVPPEDEPPARLMRLTHALGDESRLRMLRFLARTPSSSLTEVARFAGLSQPTVHHHLTQLRAAGLVRILFSASGPSRYSLRPHALEQLAEQLGAYLEVADP